MKKTTVALPAETKRLWHLIDASSANLGRVLTQISVLLMGKNKRNFSYHVDQGDYVVVINASKIRVTGRKLKEKEYNSYSGHPGGLKTFSLQELLERDPAEVIRRGIMGMLPKNHQRDKRVTRLKVFANDTHPYADKLKSATITK